MWRAIQSVPRVIRQQWGSSLRPAPQTIHYDQDDIIYYRKSSFIHNTFITPKWLQSIQWSDSDSHNNSDQQGRSQCNQEWKLPNHNNCGFKSLGWGAAIVLGLQLSKVLPLILQKDRRKDSYYVSSEGSSRANWTQWPRLGVNESDGDDSRQRNEEQIVVQDAQLHIESNDILQQLPEDFHLEEDLDVESLLDVVYIANDPESDIHPLRAFKCGSTSIELDTTPRQENQREDADDASPEKHHRGVEIREAAQTWARLSNDCSVAIHNHLGYRSMKAGVNEKAFLHWQQACQIQESPAGVGHHNTPLAHYNLALCYELGKGTQVNEELARKHYGIAAGFGHSTATYNLAVFCLHGIGGERDISLAISLLEKAAMLGIKEAQIDLDAISGKGDRENIINAAELFKEASEGNDIGGMYRLGVCYANGWGVVQNDMKAAKLFASAAEKGHPEALVQLALYTEIGRGGLEADKKKALKLFKKAALAGQANATGQVIRLTHKINEDKLRNEVALDMTTRMRVLQLYRQVRRAGQKYADYNFRTYALRRARDAFKENKGETDPQKIAAFITKAEENVAMLTRQATISQFYRTTAPLVIETNPAAAGKST